jgi:hypothetical protein
MTGDTRYKLQPSMEPPSPIVGGFNMSSASTPSNNCGAKYYNNGLNAYNGAHPSELRGDSSSTYDGAHSYDDAPCSEELWPDYSDLLDDPVVSTLPTFTPNTDVKSLAKRLRTKAYSELEQCPDDKERNGKISRVLNSLISLNREKSEELQTLMIEDGRNLQDAFSHLFRLEG